MAEEKKTFEYLPQNYEEDMLRKKRKANKRKGRDGGFEELNIDSLMDILTILLVFLLKSYATDPINIEPTSDLDIPKSSAMLKPEATVQVTVSKSAILVDNKAISGLEVKEGKVSASQKRGGEDSFFITQLHKVLTDEAEKKRRLAAINSNVKFEGLCTVIMDGETPYRLLTEIMYTAGQAEFSKYKFAIISKEG
jgi:biopolymer transport protein ExbD